MVAFSKADAVDKPEVLSVMEERIENARLIGDKSGNAGNMGTPPIPGVWLILAWRDFNECISSACMPLVLSVVLDSVDRRRLKMELVAMCRGA